MIYYSCRDIIVSPKRPRESASVLNVITHQFFGGNHCHEFKPFRVSIPRGFVENVLGTYVGYFLTVAKGMTILAGHGRILGLTTFAAH